MIRTCTIHSKLSDSGRENSLVSSTMGKRGRERERERSPLTDNRRGGVSVHEVDDGREELRGEGEGERGSPITALPPAHQQHTLEVICTQDQAHMNMYIVHSCTCTCSSRIQYSNTKDSLKQDTKHTHTRAHTTHTHSLTHSQPGIKE